MAQYFGNDFSTGYRYTPNAYFLSVRDKTYQINSMGFRDDEFVVKKKRKLVAFIGDSVIEGLGVEVSERATNLAKSSIEKSLGLAIDIYNFGIGGYSTYDELHALKNSVLQYAPDYVVLQICYNDLAHNYSKSLASEHAGSDINTADETSNTIKGLMQKNSAFYLFLAENYNYWMLRNSNPDDKLQEMLITEDEKWSLLFTLISDFAHSCSQAKSVPIVMYIPYEAEVIVEDPEMGLHVSERIVDFCKQQMIANIDVTRSLRKQNDLDNLYLDHCHLSELGNEIVGESISEFFTQRYDAGLF